MAGAVRISGPLALRYASGLRLAIRDEILGNVLVNLALLESVELLLRE